MSAKLELKLATVLSSEDMMRILAEIDKTSVKLNIGALLSVSNFNEMVKSIKIAPPSLSEQLANAMNAMKANMNLIEQSHRGTLASINAGMMLMGEANATIGELKAFASGTLGPLPPPSPVIDVGVFTDERSLSRIEVVSTITAEVIAKLRKDRDALCKLTPRQFEELIMELLSAMGNEVRQAGKTTTPDGFVDIVFWSKTGIPILGAVQVKHHDSAKQKTGIDAIQRMEGVLSKRRQEFNLGMVVTNTSFTDDAKWEAKDSGIYLRLRDEADVDRWIKGDFNSEEERREFPEDVDLTRHLTIPVRKKLQ